MHQQFELPTDPVNHFSHRPSEHHLMHAYRAYAQQVYQRSVAHKNQHDIWRFVPNHAVDYAQLITHYQTTEHIDLIDGAFVADLDYFCLRYPDKMRQVLAYDLHGRWMQSEHAAFIESFFTKGTVIFVPRDVQITIPAPMHSVVPAQSVLFEKLIIYLEQGASITLDDAIFSDEQSVVGRSVCVVAQDHATVVWKYHDSTSLGTHLAHYRFYLGDHALLQGLGCWTTNSWSMQWLDVNLCGPHAQATVEGICIGQNQQSCSLITRQHHSAPHTTSNVTIKGVLADQARSFVHGMIHIDGQSSGASADLNTKHILLSQQAHSCTEPQIEVLTDDVACTHGSAVGYLDDQELLYVMSRGITRPSAKKMLLKAFLSGIVDGMHDHIMPRLETLNYEE